MIDIMNKPIAMVIVVLITVSLSSLSFAPFNNDNDANRVLEQSGYTSIKLGGRCPLICSRNLYSTSFHAYSVSGANVSGCVCTDMFDAVSIRFR